jgi:ribulose-bisphosphate carboxylase large chain
LSRFTATYRVRAEASSIEARAQAIAVEQSVEMPLEGIDEPSIIDDIVGAVEAIQDCGDGVFDVRIGLSSATVGGDAGQLLNMLFGNTSLQEDVRLVDVDGELAFTGPNHGIEGLRRRLGVSGRALTCSALKPQGLPPSHLALLAERFARGGIDFIKDDHGLADQAYSPFAERVPAIAGAVGRSRYVPSLSGDVEAMRRQIGIAGACGVDTVLVAPMITGWSSFQTLVRDYPEMAFISHPSMGGAARIAPDLLIGKLFRCIGADAVIFPNYGGRFGYTPDTCRRLADQARAPRSGVGASLPVPAGGMTVERVPEMLDFYGRDVMLLIGGNLLVARERLTEETGIFTRAVAEHRYS